MAGVAVLDDGALLACGATGPTQRTAAALAPTLRQTARAAGVDLSDADLIAVTVGPGSFTGLRVGVTMAKTLAYAVRCEVLGIDTLEAIAHQAPGGVQSLWAVLDAQRQQLFAARFERDRQSGWTVAEASHILDAERWLAQLSADVHVAGPGLERLVGRLPEGVPILPEEFWRPQAAAVGQLANAQFAGGRRDDLWTLAPLYFRPSAAEEKWRPRP